MASNPEQLKGGPEVGPGASEAAEKQAERLRSREASVEQSPEQQAERAAEARAEASKEAEAVMGKERGGAEVQQGDNGPVIRRATKQQKEKAFQETMASVRSHLNTSERAFSKIIHNRTVERTSDIVGNTVARPNAILAGSLAAFLLTGAVYILARTFGYPLSGFETIGSFIIGFVLGILFDFFRVMITGRQSS